jgi:hypothetical protein
VRSRRLLWILAAGTMLSGAAGFAALMAGMPAVIAAFGVARPIPAVEPANTIAAIDAAPLTDERRARRRPRCVECGWIESVREADAPGAGSAGREITVRLENGSSRVIVDDNPAAWRPGERVTIIDGLVGPGA